MDKIIKSALIKLLEPIIRVLLRSEISHAEFSELSKHVFVNMAKAHFSLENKKSNDSRVSVLTGLSRKEVARIDAINAVESKTGKKTVNRATRVIGGWLSDKDFTDNSQLPKPLAIKGEEHSFESLVSRYGGGITNRSVLDELVRVKAVEFIDKHHVQLTHKGYVPDGDDASTIKVFSAHASDLLNTGIHNLENPNSPRFQRQVTYLNLPTHVIQEFERLSHDKSLALLLELNRWLADKKREHSEKRKDGEETKTRIGIGIYYFNNDNKED